MLVQTILSLNYESLNKLGEMADKICECMQVGVNSLYSRASEQAQFNQLKLQVKELSQLVSSGSCPSSNRKSYQQNSFNSKDSARKDG